MSASLTPKPCLGGRAALRGIGPSASGMLRLLTTDRLVLSGSLVQGQALAREVLPVQQVPGVAGGQAVRVQDGADILRPLLRRAVRHALRRLRRDLQSR